MPISLVLVKIFSKTPQENDPHELPHLFHAMTFDEGQRSMLLILAI
jgi:hypothetical protein